MVVAALHPVHRLLELRTLLCCPVKSLLCGSEDPAQPLPQSQGGLSPALPACKKSPRGWAATRMRGLRLIPALLTTPACPRDGPSVCSQPQRICPGLAFSPPAPGPGELRISTVEESRCDPEGWLCPLLFIFYAFPDSFCG